MFYLNFYVDLVICAAANDGDDDFNDNYIFILIALRLCRQHYSNCRIISCWSSHFNRYHRSISLRQVIRQNTFLYFKCYKQF